MITFTNNSDSEEETCNERTSLMSAESPLLNSYHEDVQAPETSETQMHRVSPPLLWKVEAVGIMLVQFIAWPLPA